MSGFKIDRRKFVETGVGAVLAASLAKRTLLAQGSAGPAEKLKVDICSRHLQWLRTADEVAEAADEMGFAGVDLTVGSPPAHVDVAKVGTDLPAFANAIRKHGLEVVTINCPIVDADSASAEAILSAAHSAGVTHYWWGPFRYEDGKPVAAQLDALKPRVEKLAKLNEKYKVKAMYHTSAGNDNVGAAVWDFLSVLKNFDPAYVSFNYDIGEMTTGSTGGWAVSMKAAGPYIGGVTLTDAVQETSFVVTGGGPFTGTPAAARGGGRGRGAAGASGGAARGGLGAGPGGPPGAGGDLAESGAPGGPGGRGGGGRGGGGRGGAAGVRGATGAPPWRQRQVPLGTGMDNLVLAAELLKEIGFAGPVEIVADYPNGDAEKGGDHITLPRVQVLGAMKRDLLCIRAAWTPLGLL